MTNHLVYSIYNDVAVNMNTHGTDIHIYEENESIVKESMYI